MTQFTTNIWRKETQRYNTVHYKNRNEIPVLCFNGSQPKTHRTFLKKIVKSKPKVQIVLLVLAVIEFCRGDGNAHNKSSAC